MLLTGGVPSTTTESCGPGQPTGGAGRLTSFVHEGLGGGCQGRSGSTV